MPETCCDIPGAHDFAGPPAPGLPHVPVVVYGRVGSGDPADAEAARAWQRVRAAEHAEKFGLRIVAEYFDTATVRRTPVLFRPQGSAMLDRVRTDPRIAGVVTADAHQMIGVGNLRAAMSTLHVPIHDLARGRIVCARAPEILLECARQRAHSSRPGIARPTR